MPLDARAAALRASADRCCHLWVAGDDYAVLTTWNGHVVIDQVECVASRDEFSAALLSARLSPQQGGAEHLRRGELRVHYAGRHVSNATAN